MWHIILAVVTALPSVSAFAAQLSKEPHIQRANNARGTQFVVACRNPEVTLRWLSILRGDPWDRVEWDGDKRVQRRASVDEMAKAVESFYRTYHIVQCSWYDRGETVSVKARP